MMSLGTAHTGTTGPLDRRAFSRYAALAAAGVVVLVLVTQMVRSAGSTQDDAFITYRYATHLVEGDGLVYNPGERVEGYTNFLWTLLLAGVIAAGGDPVAIAPWLGAACAAGVALVLLLGTGAARRRDSGSGSGESQSAAWIAGAAAALFYATGSAVAAEGVQGLETPFFALLIIGALLLDARERERGRPRGGVSGAVYALAALTRPEGVMAFGLAALLRVPDLLPSRASVKPRPGLAGEARWAASALVPIALHLLFRLAYYGDLVPNTAHAKVSFSTAVLARGLEYVATFLLAYAPVVLLAIAGVLLDMKGALTRLLASWILLDIAYVASVGGDYKPTFRFFAAAIPPLCLLAGRGLVLVGEWIRLRSLRAGWLLAGVAVTGALLWVGSAPAREFTAWRRSLLPMHTAAGRWLQSHFPPGTLLATINAGVLPYYSGLPTIDMLGLCDKVIARRPAPPDSPTMAGHEKGDGTYVLSRRPDVILFMQARFSQGPLPESVVDRLAWGVSEREIFDSASFHRDYEWKSAPVEGFVFNYYQRRNGADAPGGRREGGRP